jgi:hypothetical protein
VAIDMTTKNMQNILTNVNLTYQMANLPIPHKKIENKKKKIIKAIYGRNQTKL